MGYTPFITFLIPLLHRAGLIILISSSTLLILLPRLLPNQQDQQFLLRSNQYVKRTLIFGFLILVVSGMFRLGIVLPKFLFVKLLFVSILGFFIFFHYPNLEEEKYEEKGTLVLVLVLLTSIVGLLI